MSCPTCEKNRDGLSLLHARLELWLAGNRFVDLDTIKAEFESSWASIDAHFTMCEAFGDGDALLQGMEIQMTIISMLMDAYRLNLQ